MMASQKLPNCCVALHSSSLQRTVCTPHSSEFARLAFGAFCLAIKDKMHDKTELAGMSLKEVFLENSRSREARELVDWLASLQYEYMVIGGDFNSISLSKTARTMRDLFKDSAWVSPSLFSSSHNIQGFHLPVKVDYIFVSKNISYSGSRIIQESPGDHYPVVTNIRMD